MAIKHAFVNPKADGPDATIVRPSNWNEAHTIEGDIEMIAATDTPATPAVGKTKLFCQITGTEPNRHVFIGFILDNGTQIPIVDTDL